MNKSHFEYLPLKAIAKNVKREIVLIPTKTYQTIGCRLYGEGIYPREEKTGAEILAKKMFLVYENDLVVNRIWAQKGSVGIVPPEFSGSIVTSDFPVYEIDTNKVLPSYLAWYVRTQNFWEECKKHSYGTSGRQRLSPKELPNVVFPICDLNIQKKVVSKLETKYKKISQVKIHRKNMMAQTDLLFLNILETVFSPNQQNDWRIVKIDEVCDTKSGGTPSRNRPDYYEYGTIPWIKSGELKGDVINDAEEKISEEALKNSNAKLFPKGTLLIALYGANVGRTGILGISAATNQAICAIFPKTELNRDFLFWFFRKMKPIYILKSFGGAQPNISQKIIRNTEIPIPPLKEQGSIVNYLNGINQKLTAANKLQEEVIQTLDMLMASILNDVFSS